MEKASAICKNKQKENTLAKFQNKSRESLYPPYEVSKPTKLLHAY